MEQREARRYDNLAAYYVAAGKQYLLAGDRDEPADFFQKTLALLGNWAAAETLLRRAEAAGELDPDGKAEAQIWLTTLGSGREDGGGRLPETR